jgi:hypothetical protein
MGWGSGSSIARGVWAQVQEHLPAGKRNEIALAICKLFEDEDCDTLPEAEDLFKAAYPWEVLTLDGNGEDCDDAQVFPTEELADLYVETSKANAEKLGFTLEKFRA